MQLYWLHNGSMYDVWSLINFLYTFTAVVTLRLATDSLTIVEGDCFVNVTIEKEGETTVDSMALLRTAQSGSAVGMPLHNYVFL